MCSNSRRFPGDFQLLRATLPANIVIIDSVDTGSGAAMANAAQMHQALMNFCTNAAHAMKKDVSVVQATIAILILEYLDETKRNFQVQIFASAGPVYTLWVEGASTGLTCALTDWITVICSCDGGSAALCTVYKNGVAWYGTSKAVSSTTVNRYLQCIANGASSAGDFDLAEVKLGATR